MKRHFAVIFVITLASVFWPVDLSAAGEVRIVTTTSTLASLAKTVTGNLADVYYVASPNRDLHYTSPTPKDVLKVKRADVLFHHGMQAEPWLTALLDAAGNKRLMGDAGALIDVSAGVVPLEVPARASRADGDIHPLGNPHYWSDPLNAKLVVTNIAEGLSVLWPEHEPLFRKNAGAFLNRLDEKLEDWKTRMEAFRATPVVTYHKSWSYFAVRFGLEIVGQIEPNPGIPPSPSHIAKIVTTMKERKVPFILNESYYESRTARKISLQTGAKILPLAQFVGEVKPANDYISLIEYNIRLFEGGGA